MAFYRREENRGRGAAGRSSITFHVLFILSYRFQSISSIMGMTMDIWTRGAESREHKPGIYWYLFFVSFWGLGAYLQITNHILSSTRGDDLKRRKLYWFQFAGKVGAALFRTRLIRTSQGKRSDSGDLEFQGFHLPFYPMNESQKKKRNKKKRLIPALSQVPIPNTSVLRYRHPEGRILCRITSLKRISQSEDHTQNHGLLTRVGDHHRIRTGHSALVKVITGPRERDMEIFRPLDHDSRCTTTRFLNL